jgi:hypothetical protein
MGVHYGFGFSILTYRLGTLLDRLLPLDLDQRNNINPSLDQTIEVVSEGLYQRLKLVLDRSSMECPFVQPSNTPPKDIRTPLNQRSLSRFLPFMLFFFITPL